MTAPRRAVIGYVRVSTAEQAREGVSLAAQASKLRAWAAAMDADLMGVEADAGVSAKGHGRALTDTLAHRPGLARTLTAARRRRRARCWW